MQLWFVTIHMVGFESGADTQRISSFGQGNEIPRTRGESILIIMFVHCDCSDCLDISIDIKSEPADFHTHHTCTYPTREKNTTTGGQVAPTEQFVELSKQKREIRLL